MILINSKTATENFTTEIKSVSGHTLLSDEPEDIGGKNKGMSPDELILAALASCTSATVKMYAQHKKWDIQEIKTEIKLNTGKKPTDFQSIERKIEFIGDLDTKQRERLLQVANKCPIHKLLSEGIEIHTEL